MSTTRDFHLPGNVPTSTASSSSLSCSSSSSPGHSPYSAKQREMAKAQLERILASSLFRNSKRFPDFLRYTVNHALTGETQGLKERTLGVSVFGRHPDYDTSTDPVVRVTAAEVRKRITQYYEALGHEHEMRIEFERGSYVPEFKFSYDAPRREAAAAAPATTTTAHEKRRRANKYWLVAGCAVTACAAIATFLLLGGARQTVLDQFWGPVVSTNGPALLCVPDPAPQASRTATAHGRASLNSASGFTPAATPQTTGIASHMVTLGDSVALSLVSGVLGREGQEFHVRATDDVTLDDLKEGPVVLIGAFDNEWTMRLASGLRFAFGHDDSAGYIADLKNPASRQWAVGNQFETGNSSVDYGLISRVIDATTGHSVVTVGGLHHFGTEAAAECLTQTTCLEAAAKLAPGNWKKSNLQIVLRTTVIGDNSGQPQVLAAYLW